MATMKYVGATAKLLLFQPSEKSIFNKNEKDLLRNNMKTIKSQHRCDVINLVSLLNPLFSTFLFYILYVYIYLLSWNDSHPAKSPTRFAPLISFRAIPHVNL